MEAFRVFAQFQTPNGKELWPFYIYSQGDKWMAARIAQYHLAALLSQLPK